LIEGRESVPGRAERGDGGKQVKGSFEKAGRVELPSKKRGQGVCKEQVLHCLNA